MQRRTLVHAIVMSPLAHLGYAPIGLLLPYKYRIEQGGIITAEPVSRTKSAPNFIADSAGVVWGLVASRSKGNQVCRNDVVQTDTSNVVLLLYMDQVMYHRNSAGKWYAYKSNSWTLTDDPTVTDNESAEGTQVTMAGPIIYASKTRGQASIGPFNTFALTSDGHIAMHNGSISGANVVGITYHNHTVYQHAVAGGYSGWWWWDTTASAWSSQLTTTVTLSTTTYPPGATAGTMIAAITVTMSDGAPFCGTLSVDDTTHFDIVGDHLRSTTTLSGDYPVTITATPQCANGVAYGDPGTTKLTLSRASSVGRPYLIGYFGTGPAHEEIGYYPDATINNSYMSPDFGTEGGGGDMPDANNGYPTVICVQSFNIGNPTPCNSATGAAKGHFNSYYAHGIKRNIAPYASHIYAVRINHEWCLSEWSWSPYYGNGVDPDTWIAGYRNLVNAFRTYAPRIKIAWDFPLASKNATAASDYYPGDAYVDIISADVYFLPAWNGSTSRSGWDYYQRTNSLAAWASFAKAHNKPMAIWEWADGYNDGYCLNNLANWIKQNNVVGHFYWDIGPDFAFSVCPNSLVAYKSAFPSSLGPYNGSFFDYLPLPTAKPSWA